MSEAWKRLKEAVMGRTVTDLAKAVDDAQALLDTAEGRLAEQLGRVAAEEENVRLAREDRDAAVQALVTEHPHLVGNKNVLKEARVQYPTHDEAIANPGAWDPEVIEVDDENDPRYTAGAGRAIDASDSAPLPPIDFDERDGE